MGAADRVSLRACRSSLRRRVVLATTVVLVTASGLIGAGSPASAQTEPDPDLNSYVLFGFEELDFKGGQGNHGPSIIDGGNIGVNGSGFIRGNDFRMNICANARMIMSDDTMVVSDTLRMGDSSTPTQECDVYEVFNNTAANNNEQSRTGPALPFTPPPIKATPPFPAYTCDALNPVNIGTDQTATLSPGTYGQMQFQNGSTVTLTAGTYTLCGLNTGQHVTVITEPGVVLQVAGAFLANDDLSFDGSDCAAIPIVYVRGDGVTSNNNAVRFGQDSEVWGHFYAPTGRLNLGNQTDLHGTFWARAIGSDFNVDVEYCPPPIPPPETGDIEVTKQVTGDPAGLPPDAQFTIHYNCTIPGPGVRDALDGSFALAAGATRTFTDVQVGTTCTGTEVDTPPPLPGFVFDPPVFIPANTVTITTGGQTVEVVIENPMREVFGTIEVTKLLVGDLAGFVPGSVFGFTLDCEDDAFDTSFTLAPGETLTSDPIHVGVPCTITETAVPDPAAGFVYLDPVLVPVAGRVVIGEENQTVTVTATNRLAENVGRFRVVKAVTGDVAGYVQGSEFRFSLDCDIDGFDTTFSLADGEAFVSPDMPVGTTCEAAETSVPAPASGFTWSAPVWTPDPPLVTLTAVDQTVTLRAENELVGPTPEPPAPGIGPDDAGPGGTSTDALPGTGGPGLWLLGFAGALIASGAVLVVGGLRQPT